MTVVEIVLIAIGTIFMIGSFLVTEKLSQKEVSQISELSSIEMKEILKKNMENAEKTVEKMVENVVGTSIETADRAMQKETNRKIHEISEYAETVVESIHKNHEEVMFLYSMLNDKQSDIESTVKKIEKLKAELQKLEQEMIVHIADSTENKERIVEESSELPLNKREIGGNEALLFLEKEPKFFSKNKSILDLYRQGMDIVDIAKQLGRGVGETKLVIDLYREGKV